MIGLVDELQTKRGSMTAALTPRCPVGVTCLVVEYIKIKLTGKCP